MIICTWTESFSVGNSVLDGHHQKLFALVNNLAAAMIAGAGREKLDATFKELLRYTKDHFSAEEKVFQKTAYPNIDEHKAEHRRLEKELDNLRERSCEGEAGMSVHTLDFIKQWIENHIMQSDMSYVPYLASSD